VVVVVVVVVVVEKALCCSKSIDLATVKQLVEWVVLVNMHIILRVDPLCTYHPGFILERHQRVICLKAYYDCC
jgi:hypothetical protein